MPPEPEDPGPRRILLAALACGLLALAALEPPEVHAWSRAACKVLLATAACLLLPRRAGEPRWLPRWTWGLLPFATAAVYSASSRARAFDEASDAVALVLAAVLGRAIAADARARDVLSRLLVALACVAALLAIVQHHATYPIEARALRSGQEEASAYVLARLEAGRPSGRFTLPAALGGFLALTLPMTLAWAGRGGRAQSRAALILAALLQVYALVLTSSVGALFATAVSLFLVLPVLSRRRVALLRGALAAAAIAGVALFLHARRQEIAAPGGDPLLLRAGNWAVAAEMIRDHPLFGTGPGSFGTFYPRYMRTGMNETRYAHNSYLQVLSGWGAWGVVPLLALLIAVSGRLRAAWRAAGDDRSSLAAGAGFLAHNLIDFTSFLPGVAIPAAMLLGIGLEGGTRARGDSPGARAVGAVPSPHGVASAGRAIDRPPRALATLLVFGGAMVFVAQAAVSARSQILLEKASAAAEEGDIRGSLELARAAARVRPEDEAPRAFIAEWVLAHGMSDPGLKREGDRAAVRALTLNPESAILHFTASRYHDAAGESADAYRELRTAHVLFPIKDLYRLGAGKAGEKGAP
ncbi:MAG: hypothetical protein AUH92_03445 [Acidobacteria bacterium 13_1_40CM_4_69_4]|nr:MAG: hypothetical protein AUH92_03445 [Acidobacteria bacterium 13_1_40CM_4_69_4]